MSRVLAFLLAAAVIGAVCPLAGYHGTIAYLQHVHRTLPAYVPEAEVLILGASNMSRWPERAPDSYRATFGIDVTNAAKPGWSTEVLRSHLPLETEARVIVLGDLGSPDLREGRTPMEAALGVRGVVDALLTSTDAEIVVLALTPRMLGAVDGCAKVDETNWWVRGFLAYRPRVTIVDTPIPHDEAYYLPDGSHLSPLGYSVVAAELRRALDRITWTQIVSGGAP